MKCRNARIDVIYICSNADIARQNIDRLKIPGCEEAAQATRLTLLPLQMHDLRRHRVNFVALTPATSFEQTGGGGRMDERVLLYWLLDRAWGIHGSRASLYVMQDYAGTASFKRGVNAFDFDKLNEQIADEFVSSPGEAGTGRNRRRETGYADALRGVARHILPQRLQSVARRNQAADAVDRRVETVARSRLSRDAEAGSNHSG